MKAHTFTNQPLPRRRGGLARAAIGAAVLAGVVLVVALSAHSAACADANPFAGMRQSAPTGITGWILAEQSRFYRALSGLIRAAKTDGSALWALMGISFIYGIFHAAGPGHGKAVISSYLVANEETWRRGIILSFASALLQAKRGSFGSISPPELSAASTRRTPRSPARRSAARARSASPARWRRRD